MKIYFDFRDWWVGYYRGPNHHYICLLPTLVIRFERKRRSVGLPSLLEMPIITSNLVPKDKIYMINQPTVSYDDILKFKEQVQKTQNQVQSSRFLINPEAKERFGKD